MTQGKLGTKEVETVWAYKGSDGGWHPFFDEKHRLNTIADGGWDVREFFAAPTMQVEPVAVVEVMSDMSQVWIALKTQWLPVGKHNLYTTPQPAEQQPDVTQLVEALEFYAKGEHFTPYDPDQWDTVSGEPLNILHHDDGADGSAGFVEDGSIAKAAIAAHRKQGGEE